MFPIILIVVFVALMPISVFVAIAASDAREEGFAFLSALVGFAALCLLITVLIVWPTTYFTSVGDVAEMEAFYYDTLESYEYTVTATGDIDITNAETGLVDVAYQEQGVATSERLRELRDRVEWFNTKLRHLEKFNSMFIADAFLADLPEGLSPIVLGGQQND